jgi:hypothetical protein
MNHNVTRNITPPYRGGVVTLRYCYGCYVTVTLIVAHVGSLWASVTPKLLNVTLGLLRFLCQLGQCLPGQSGQGVCFSKNSVNHNVNLASGHRVFTSESSGLIVL